MRFKTDENIHPEIAELLRAAGHDAQTVWDENLRGFPDPAVGKVCQAESRALITFDVGFADLRQYAPQDYPGLIVLRLGSQSRPHVLAIVKRLLPVLEREPLPGNLWIVEEKGIRIRGHTS